MKQKIVFLGNAQARALYVAWVVNIPGSDLYDSHVVHYWYITEEDREAIRTADIIVWQVSDWRNHDVEALNLRARIVLFPYVNGAFLWPFCGPAHPNWGSTSMHQYGIFQGDMGDGYLAKLFRRGVPASEAVDLYANLDVMSAGNVERRYELGLDAQRRRDAKAGLDISMADYIERNISREILFVTRQTLAKSVFWHLASNILAQLLRMLGDCEAKVVDGEHLAYIQLGGRLEMPIHPKIAEHFNLPGLSEGYRYRVNHNRLTFNEYAADYMNGTYQEDIFNGIELFERGEHEASVPILQRGLAAAPRSPNGAFALSRAYASVGRDKEALELACAAVHRDVENRDFLIDLAQRYMTCGYYAAARAVLERALEIHPCYPTANKMLCDILWHHGDRDQAILLSREFAAKIAHSAFAHFQLGHLLRESGDLDGAESSYRKSLTADRGESFATHHQLADVLSRQGRFDEGIALVRSYVDRHNDDSASHALLGQMLWRADRLNDAEHAYRQAIQYAPNDLELKVALADLISAMGRLDEAIALARSLAERNHDSASVYSLLARLFWRKNDLQAAIEAYRTATVLAPENEGLKVQLFQVLATGGHYDEALSIVHLPELRGSRDPAVHVQIGELFLQAGDLTAAEAAFATAISYDETNEPAKAGQQEVRRRGI